MCHSSARTATPPHTLTGPSFPLCTAHSLPSLPSRGQQPAHLEAYVALLAAEAGDHEEDEGEEAREGDGHHCQG